jgi:Leucine-rich repeat (LRR) protein
MTLLENPRSIIWLSSQDKLPPNLEELQWTSITLCSHRARQPLLALSRLQKLTLGLKQMYPAAADLSQLRSLRNLQEVELAYTNERFSPLFAGAEASAAAWLVLPVRSLSLVVTGSVTEALLQHLGKLTGLKSLSLTFGDVASLPKLVGVLPKLAGVLPKLAGLQQLTMVLKAATDITDEAWRHTWAKPW